MTIYGIVFSVFMMVIACWSFGNQTPKSIHGVVDRELRVHFHLITQPTAIDLWTKLKVLVHDAIHRNSVGTNERFPWNCFLPLCARSIREMALVLALMSIRAILIIHNERPRPSVLTHSQREKYTKFSGEVHCPSDCTFQHYYRGQPSVRITPAMPLFACGNICVQRETEETEIKIDAFCMGLDTQCPCVSAVITCVCLWTRHKKNS